MALITDLKYILFPVPDREHIGYTLRIFLFDIKTYKKTSFENSIFAFVQKPPAAHIRKSKITILKRRKIGERRYKLFVLNTDRFKYHTKYLRFINTASPSSYSFRLLSNTYFPDLIGIEAAYCYLTTLSVLPTLINARIALSRCSFS